MMTRLSFVAIFIAGVIAGWVGKTWYDPMQSGLARDDKNTVYRDGSENLSRDGAPGGANGDFWRSATQESVSSFSSQDRQRSTDNRTIVTGLDAFRKLLGMRLYSDAMVLYQEQVQQNGQSAGQFKGVLLDQLKQLSETRNNNDFSELIENYLSVYYDDVDVLLQLADFNQANGSYFEVVDVYLLAKTYAYSDTDQRKVYASFNDFVEAIDGVYTNQKNWLSLINLYSHIESSGLLTSPYRYRQALAYLRSGDEYFAIEQFNQLLSDSLVGEAAALALNNLTGISEAPVVVTSSVWEGAESITLQQVGNQYLVDLTGGRQATVKLLIDTGASMTTLSRLSFDNINADGDAVEQERRLFRTASGVIMGTVYLIPELRLGPYSLQDTQIAVLDNFGGDREIDGLLGMNILGQFRFQIDQDEGRLLLSRE